MPVLTRILCGGLLLAGCTQVPLDPFGRSYAGAYTVPAGTQPCTDPEVDVQPRMVRGNLPLSPAENYYTARNAAATVHYRVSAQGKVDVLSVDSGSDKWFGNYAKIALNDWTMLPARRNGVAVAAECRIVVRALFRGLEDAPAGQANQ